jgi:hypothetical protein
MPIRGSITDREATTPDISIFLPPGGLIVGVFGRISTTLASIGFWTSDGTQYGPYGSADEGDFFAFTGQVYSFFGSVSERYKQVTGLGFWTDAPAPPPAPTLLPPPPAPPLDAPSPPARPPLPNLGRIRTYVYGNLGDENAFWDDGPSYTG